MPTDDAQIRDLVQAWLVATKAGDVETVLGLMTDDAVFLTPGRPPMTKADFAAASHGSPGSPRPRLDGTVEIEELQVCGDLAYTVCRLHLSITMPGGTPTIERAGETLSIFRRESGRWRLSRDANLLVAIEPS